MVSKYLELKDVTRSLSAKRLGIDNSPTPEHLQNIKKIGENIYDPLVVHFKNTIGVSSGYRSAALNKSIGGSKSSQHMTGEALDLDQDGLNNGVTNKMIFDYIRENLDFDQLIWEFGDSTNPDWVHVSYESSGKQRRQVLKAVRSKDKVVYVRM
jgi:zinc D-Ala-D-Ala carboxypeptidase